MALRNCPLHRFSSSSVWQRSFRLRASTATGDRGVLAPNSPLRAPVTALARPPDSLVPAPLTTSAGDASHSARRSPARLLWAVLLARV
jgi:hypothetical protein